MGARIYRLLGGLEVIDGSVRLDLGARKQRAVLAALLLAEGQVVTVDRLSDVLWGDDPPERYEASLQSYISVLRRMLEPDRAPRAQPSVLVTRGSGYALLAGREQVDVQRFTDLVEQGLHLHSGGDLPAAGATLRNALATYAPLLPEFDGEQFRDTAATHLARVHAAALEHSYEIRLALGDHRLLVTELEAVVRREPMNEGMWALLATARYRLGLQGDALRALADCRRILSEEIGVDPSPRLRQLEADILAQAPHLEGAPTTPAAARPSMTVPRPPGGGPEGIAHPTVMPSPGPIIGRREELRQLFDAVAAAAGGGRGLVLVEGEPGAGKTRLIEEAALLAVEHGAIVLWGRCMEGAGTPAMWPWVQAVSELLDSLDSATREYWLSGELGQLLEVRRLVPAPAALPDAGAQFRMFELAASVVEQAAILRPVLLVIDDLQWADPASLQLFDHLAVRLARNTLLIGSMRDRAPTPIAELSRTLAGVSRLPGVRRIHLGPLEPAEVAALVREETGREPDAASAASMHSRTGGNPFFVRELARLLLETGDPSPAIPSGVRDVVRGRMSVLDAPARSLLQAAAVIGRDVDLGLLARAADLDVEQCLDLLESVEALGLMSPTPGDPFSYRFAHDLIRESITESTPTPRVTRLHLRVADALERGFADTSAVSERLAFHLWAAGPLADRERVGNALLEAGRRAVEKHAYQSGERHLESAVSLARGAGLEDMELKALTILISVVGMRLGYVGTAIELLERAEELARRSGQERPRAEFLYSLWASYSQGIQLDRSGPLAARLRDLGDSSDDPAVRIYGAHAWGIHQWDLGNIGESLRYLSESNEQFEEMGRTKSAGLRQDLYLLSPAMLAQMTALAGDVPSARLLLDRMERDQAGDPYGQTVWGAFAATIAAQVGDPAWAVRVALPCIESDPEFAFVFLGTYLRIAYWWGTAALGGDPVECVARIEEMIDSMPTDPPRSGMATWYTLLAETELLAQRSERAGAALDRADWYLETYGQRYCEGLTLLVRARWLHARGEDEATVRAAIGAARALSVERGALLFAQRADAFAATL